MYFVAYISIYFLVGKHLYVDTLKSLFNYDFLKIFITWIKLFHFQKLQILLTAFSNTFYNASFI